LTYQKYIPKNLELNLKNWHPYENKKFYKRLRERFLEHIESLQTVSKAEIATLQRLNDVYIRKAFAKRLKSDSKLSVRRCISVY